jgi:hypothetical protein
MSTTNRKKTKSSSIDYSVYVNQPLIVVDCQSHSSKEGMFVVKVTSNINNHNPLIPMVFFGFQSFKKNDIVSMYINRSGYPTLTPTVGIDTYQKLHKFTLSYNEQLESLNSLQ